MGEMYENGEYLANNPDYDVDDSPWKAQQVLRMMRRNGVNPRTMCEVGCGAGEILAQLQRQMSRTVTFNGYDVSPHAIELAQTRQNDQLRFECADFVAVDTGPLDLLLCIDVFEHVLDYLGFLERLRGRATYTIFHIPLDLSVQSLLRMTPILQNRERVGHLHYYVKDTALLTLQDTGYEVVDWFYTASGVDRGDSFGAKVVRLPRRVSFKVAPDLAVRVLGGYSLMVLAR